MPRQYRQGDLLFLEVDAVPGNAVKLDHRIIAEGESSGHAHQVIEETAVLYQNGIERFLEALSDSSIVHEEHRTIILPRGIYRVIPQRVYTTSSVMRVRD
jgi:hypothetical protein